MATMYGRWRCDCGWQESHEGEAAEHLYGCPECGSVNLTLIAIPEPFITDSEDDGDPFE